MNAFEQSLDGGLLEASAGTGKTYTLATLYLRLLIERQLPIESILVVTFTNAATAELRWKLRQRLRLVERALADETLAPDDAAATLPLLANVDRVWLATHLETALQRFDAAPILTIHGFCSRLLAEMAFESGTDLWFDLNDLSGELLSEHVEETLARELADRSIEEVELLRSQLGNLETERKILDACLQQPHAIVEPRSVTAPELEAIRARYFAATTALRDEAVRDGTTFGDLLRDANKRLQANTMTGRIEALATILPERPLDERAVEAITKLHEYLAKIPINHGAWRHAIAPLLAPALDAWRELDGAMRRTLVYLRRRLYDTAGARLAAWRREHRVRDYQSLIDDVHAALHGPLAPRLLAAAATRYRAALIDEFQDTDPTQYEIFFALFGRPETPLFLIGDPKQAIYGFRGADVFAYLDVAKRSATTASLDVNYRSAPALVRALHALYQSHPLPFLHPDIRYVAVNAGRVEQPQRDDEPRAGLRFLLIDPVGSASIANQDLTIAVADDIAQLLSTHPQTKPSEIAVLCRTNGQIHDVAAALHRRGIPSVTYGDTDVFETDDADDFLHLVRALAGPRRPAALAVALATRALGATAEDLLRLRTDEAAWEATSDRFFALYETWRQHGFLAAFRALCSDFGVTQRLLADEAGDGERRLTNLLHLAELAHRAAFDERLAPEQLATWIERQRRIRLIDIAARERRQVRLETDDAAVRLTTIHRSKGLEYSIVYCPFVGADRMRPSELTRYHDPESGRVVLGLDGREAELANQEDRQETMRLLYVALTRAKQQLVIALGPSRSLATSTLGYLLFGGEEVRADVIAAQLEKRIAAAGNDVWIERVSTTAPPIRLAAPTPTASITPTLRAAPTIDRAFRSHSFTSIVRSGAEDELVKDLDLPAENVLPPEVPPDVRRGQTLALFAADDPVELAEFPRGAEAGRLLHRILERWVKERPLPADAVAVELAAAGLPAERYAEVLARLLAVLPQIELPPLAADVAPPRPFAGPARALCAELEFTLPIAAPASIARLAAVMEAHADGLIAPDYGAQIAQLGEARLAGLLRGFIDLVFVADGRYYVVDYKSNFLGKEGGDYHESRLLQPMLEHDYGLQALLYSLALHRHLRLTLPSYDPERHFGGTYYLFLRGLLPWRGGHYGVFAHRPTTALLHALDALCDGQVT